jgi:hypothetical protein
VSSPTSTRREALLSLLGLAGAAAGIATVGSGCAAIYPELATRTDPVPPNRPLEPPPPDDLRWLAFESAEIPPTTRDGRRWGRTGSGLPDAVARLFVNDVEVLRTDPAPKTLNPRFDRERSGNFPLKPGDALRVELWDSDPLNDRAIGKQATRVTPEMLSDARWRARFDMGGSVTLLVEPAHAIWGLGFWYELRQGAASVTRLLDNSPASRAGLRKGDAIVAIGPTDVAVMTPDEVRSAINAPPPDGLGLTVRHLAGATLKTKVVPGPIYATFAQHGPID